MSVPVFLFPYMRGLIVQLLPALEFVTQGVVRATSHRVLAPPLDSKTPRYSVPFFFSGMDLETRVDENVLTSEYTIFQWSHFDTHAYRSDLISARRDPQVAG